jgi:hypothetical protein
MTPNSRKCWESNFEVSGKGADLSQKAFTTDADDQSHVLSWKVPPPPNISGKPHQFSFAKENSQSDSGLASHSHEPTDPNTLLTEMILQRTKEIKRNRENDSYDPPKEVEIHNIDSDEILNLTATPFTHEECLPNIEHGSVAYYYFQTLQKILNKCIRAQHQNEFIKECLQKKIIPRGFKLNKSLQAVEPSLKLNLDYYKISAKAETEMMIDVTHHYVDAVPKLAAQFKEFYGEIKTLGATDKRLVILKLIHLKNVEIADLLKKQTQKIESLSNNDGPNCQQNRGGN